MLFAELAHTADDVQFTYDDLYAIRRAIAKGELRVTFADREVLYRSIDDLTKAEQRIVGALQTEGRPKQFHGRTCKGL